MRAEQDWISPEHGTDNALAESNCSLPCKGELPLDPFKAGCVCTLELTLHAFGVASNASTKRELAPKGTFSLLIFPTPPTPLFIIVFSQSRPITSSMGNIFTVVWLGGLLWGGSLRGW